MPRKKKAASAEPDAIATSSTALAELPPAAEVEPPVAEAATDTAPSERTFSNPYRAVFTSKSAGVELGENYRFKQRVLSFEQKPADHVIATLKEHGFTYRPAEKSWTIPATAESRVLTDRLAREFAGQEHAASR